MKWINVNDRLPETEGLYFVVCNDIIDKVIKTLNYNKSEQNWGIFGRTDITHWQPLPEPPTEKD